MLGALAWIAVAAVALAAQAPGGAASAANPAGGAGPATPSAASRTHFDVGGTHSPRTERLLGGGPHLAQVKRPNPGDVLGIDVGSGQHAGGASIDWPEVAAAGYRFAFIKATEGSYYANPHFASDLAAAQAAGLLVAPYHFANPSYSTGRLQADFALNDAGLGDNGMTLPLILDIEYDPYSSNWCYGLSARQMVAWIGAFTSEVYRRTGHYPVIYTLADWWAKCTASSTAFAGDPLWVASYDGKKSPALPTGWSTWAYWQYTSVGQVPGIVGDTDISELNPAALEVATSANQSTAGLSLGQARLAIKSINAVAGQALSYSAAGLPPGLTINASTGAISGTADGTPGGYPSTVTVSKKGLVPVTDSFTWNVYSAPVQVTQPSAQSGLLGRPASLQVAVSDSLPGCTLTFSAIGLPPGLAISPCGLISGWLDRPGRYRPTVTISDSSGHLAATSFSWLVRGPAATGPTGHIARPGRGGCLAYTNARLGVAACRPVAGQRWAMTNYGGLRLREACLAPLGQAGRLQLRPCRVSLFQQWQPGADGALTNDETGACLTAVTGKHGDTVELGGCSGAKAQRWTLPAGPLTSGIPGWCASSWHVAGMPAGPVTLRQCGSARATAWTALPSGTLQTSAGCLTLTYPAVAGAAVVIARCRGTGSQQWQPLGTGPLAELLVNPVTGLCLADPNDAADHAALALRYCVAADPGTSWRLS
jgi:GH25 family lysozyme M1 (1,4-beta-N-acetylmuramidase)